MERHFALTDNDVAAVNERFRRGHRAGVAIQLVFLRASRYVSSASWDATRNPACDSSILSAHCTTAARPNCRPTVTGRRVSDLVRQAYDHTTVRQARSAIEYRHRLVAIKALVHDSERTAQERLDVSDSVASCLQ
nr:DUF4158 domain-containing protein [Paraburkholderia atlantica]